MQHLSHIQAHASGDFEHNTATGEQKEMSLCSFSHFNTKLVHCW